MVKAVGVVTECNPFHNGHASLFSEIRRRFPDRDVVCVQSGNFVQRGEFAVADKYARAEETVRGGADLVLELIPPYSALSAEAFAQSAVSVLARTGLCDTLAFGSEVPDAGELVRIARRLADGAFQKALAERAAAEPGAGFPALRQTLYEELYGPCPTLSLPNASLGLAYLEAVSRNGYDLKPMPLPRTEGNSIRSATALRAMMLEGKKAEAARYMPEGAADRLLNGAPPVPPMPLGQTLLYKIRSAAPEELEGVYGFGPLARRAAAKSADAATAEELFVALKSAGLTDSRIRRSLLALLLGTPRGVENTLPPYTLVLAAGARGRELLSHLRDHPGAIPVFTRPSRPLKAGDLRPAASRASFADSLYALALGLPGGY
ncbi:MAG: nucleotidyltransferase family protein, partial [Clostridia bacterium]|nr:nucleotidyltransferase family protein [Clostridia bacterium]